MEQLRTDIMGMPIRLRIVGEEVSEALFEKAFSLLEDIDERFSTYKETSEISKINRDEIAEGAWSIDMEEVFEIAEVTKEETGGYFDIEKPDGTIDPSGVVKGWAIQKVYEFLIEEGVENFLIDIAGDIATHGVNEKGESWALGIKNPLNETEVIKIVYPKGAGMATSGTYARGAHIYNPHIPSDPLDTFISLTVVAPTILLADLLATSAFAMGAKGMEYLQELDGVEGYAVRKDGTATMTTGFNALTTV